VRCSRYCQEHATKTTTKKGSDAAVRCALCAANSCDGNGNGDGNMGMTNTNREQELSLYLARTRCPNVSVSLWHPSAFHFAGDVRARCRRLCYYVYAQFAVSRSLAINVGYVGSCIYKIGKANYYGPTYVHRCGSRGLIIPNSNKPYSTYRFLMQSTRCGSLAIHFGLVDTYKGNIISSYR